MLIVNHNMVLNLFIRLLDNIFKLYKRKEINIQLKLMISSLMLMDNMLIGLDILHQELDLKDLLEILEGGFKLLENISLNLKLPILRTIFLKMLKQYKTLFGIYKWLKVSFNIMMVFQELQNNMLPMIMSIQP